MKERSNCPLCTSEKYSTLVKMPFDEPQMRSFLGTYYRGKVDHNTLSHKAFELVQCSHCGFVWQKNILDERGMEQLYARWISPEESLKKKENNDALMERYGKEIIFAKSLVPRGRKQSLRALDFGAGWGFWCCSAKNHGLDVVGVEIAPDRITYAAEQLDVRIVPALEDIPDNDLFDIINAEQVFEHIPNPLEVFRSIINRLAPEGVLHISVPNGAKMPEIIKAGRWYPEKGPTQPLEHINTFSPETLVTFAGRAGIQFAYNGTAAFRRLPFLARVLDRRPISTSLYFRKVR